MKTKILVTVMTYPSLSKKHFETVCTAGFKEDGSWIRIYPIPYRLMINNDDIIYKKWQWIEADIEKNSERDDRPESYHIVNIDSLKILNKIDFKPDWNLRKEWVFKNKKVFRNLSELICLTKKNEQSLAVLKPSEIIDVIYTKVDLSKYKSKLKELSKKYDADKLQLNLFDDPDKNANFIFAEKIPYRFKYVFKTEDGIERKLTINDWELGMLYRHSYQKTRDELESCKMVRNKFLELAAKKDLYLFLGTTYEWQKKNANDPYMIIGVFYPPLKASLPLFPDF